MSHLLTITGILLSTAISVQSVVADEHEPSARNRELVALATAVAAGAIDVAFARIPQDTPFVVPTGKGLVLTDFVCSPQAQGGNFSLQINASPEVFTTQLTFVASSAEPSSFQVHLQTGLFFAAGGKVLIAMLSGSASLNCYAYGFLETPGSSHPNR
jgi:hypothetical protein